MYVHYGVLKVPARSKQGSGGAMRLSCCGLLRGQQLVQPGLSMRSGAGGWDAGVKRPQPCAQGLDEVSMAAATALDIRKNPVLGGAAGLAQGGVASRTGGLRIYSAGIGSHPCQ